MRHTFLAELLNELILKVMGEFGLVLVLRHLFYYRKIDVSGYCFINLNTLIHDMGCSKVPWMKFAVYTIHIREGRNIEIYSEWLQR